MIDASRQFVDAYGYLMEPLNELRHRPFCHLDVSLKDLPDFVVAPDFPAMRSAAKWLSLAALVDAMDGDVESALVRIESTLAIGGYLVGAPTILGQLVGMATDDLAYSTLIRVMSTCELNNDQLLRIEKRIDELDRWKDFRAGIHFERLKTVHAIEYIWREGLDGWSQYSKHERPSPLQRAGQFTPGVAELDIAKTLELISDMYEAATSVESAMDEARRIVSVTKNLPGIYYYTPLYNGFRDVHVYAVVRQIAYDRIVRTLISAERFRMRHGRWPDALSELVPDYMSEVPIDPLSTENRSTLRYRVGDKGIIVYSVGRNGVDDGGAIFRSETTLRIRDIGRRLVHPEWRGRLASKE